MSRAVKSTKKKGASGAAPEKDPFQLPRSISKQIRQCVLAQAAHDTGPGECVRFLWIKVTHDGLTEAAQEGHELSVDHWLNVVDEAATLGVKCLAICVGKSFQDYPGIWRICSWAQRQHNMHVGVHVSGDSITEEDTRELRRLNASQTCIFVAKENLPLLASVEEYGIKVCPAEVTCEDHTPPCDEPKNMVFVGPEGVLYTCGLVLGKDEFRLGNALETSIEEIVRNDSLPRHVPQWVSKHAHGCDGCPPFMVKRIQQ